MFEASHYRTALLVANLRGELVQAEAASTLPAEPDFAAVETLVVDLHRRSLGDPRFSTTEE